MRGIGCPTVQVMGVVNVTPDSFSDGGRFLDRDAALAHARALVAQGAHWIDVGGESTRPRAEPVPEAEELRRVLPVVEALAAEGVAVSIDTRKAAVAEAAVAAGARMVNDVSASPALAAVAAATGVAFAAMHMRGDPATMQQDPRYDDVVAEVRDYLVARADAARAAGVAEVWVDPGIGFGKTLDHNLDLLANLDVLVATGYPVLVGTSRKAMLGQLAARATPGGGVAPESDRLEGSLATAVWARLAGAAMVRVHDVGATVRALGAVEVAAAPAA
jgi:dihydropteroate synthase